MWKPKGPPNVLTNRPDPTGGVHDHRVALAGCSTPASRRPRLNHRSPRRREEVVGRRRQRHRGDRSQGGGLAKDRDDRERQSGPCERERPRASAPRGANEAELDWPTARRRPARKSDSEWRVHRRPGGVVAGDRGGGAGVGGDQGLRVRAGRCRWADGLSCTGASSRPKRSGGSDPMRSPRQEYRSLGQKEWADMQAAGWRLVKVHVEVRRVIDPPKRHRRQRAADI